jgi:arginyl-tRNA synthetase
MKERLRKEIIKALKDLEGLDEEQLPSFSVEEPHLAAHGDLASNIALLLAKKLKKSPRSIAEALAKKLGEMSFIQKMEVAGPGFLNAYLCKTEWQKVLVQVLKAKNDYGRSPKSDGPDTMVEFISANPTGPLHFGHGRGAVVGDVLANVLEFSGRKVSKEYYVNDAGNQVRNLALSIAYWLAKQHGGQPVFPADGYKGDYVADLADKAPAPLKAFLPGPPSKQDIKALEDYGIAAMLEMIKKDLSDFGVKLDRFSSERELVRTKRLEEALEELDKNGVIEKKDGAIWFRSDRFGDEKARVLIKSDGSNTYFATDIAYHLDKLRRGFGFLINIWGADHHGYIQRVKAALEALGHPPGTLEIVMVQMVSLLRDGHPVLLRKREGDYVTLRQVFDEVGRDAARFFFLMRSIDSQMDFDLDLAKKKSLDNPVFYVQYAHARLSGLLRKAKEEGLDVPSSAEAAKCDLSTLVVAEEIRLLKKMAGFAELIKRSADQRAPQLLVSYLQEMAGDFHSYFSKYRKTDPILKGDRDKVAARLLLVRAIRQIFRNALRLLGISSPDRMGSLEIEEKE